jgi:hypothetical protein
VDPNNNNNGQGTPRQPTDGSIFPQGPGTTTPIPIKGKLIPPTSPGGPVTFLPDKTPTDGSGPGKLD